MESDCAYQTKTPPKDWTPEEVKLLMRLKGLGRNWVFIASHFPGRTQSAVVSRYQYEMAAPSRPKTSAIPFVREPIPEAVLAEQARRAIAWGQRTLTASICGDPPKGFSALDRAPANKFSVR